MARKQKAALTVKGKSYSIYEGHNTIGRSPSATIVVKDLRVSHNHAIITVIDEKHFVSEISSCNGTYLNEEKLVPLILYEVHNNAEIKFGNVTAIYSTTVKQNTNDSSDTQNYSESFFEAPTQLLDVIKSCSTNISINDLPTQVLDGRVLNISDIHNVNTQIQDFRRNLANDSDTSINDLPTQHILQESFENNAILERIIDETKCTDFNDADSNDSVDLLTMQQYETTKQDACKSQERDSPLHTSQLCRKINRTIYSESESDDEKSYEPEILKYKTNLLTKPVIDSSDDETDLEDVAADKDNENNSHNSVVDEAVAETDGEKERISANKLDKSNDSDFIPSTQEANAKKSSKNNDNILGSCSLGDNFHLHLTELTSTEKSENFEDSSKMESPKTKDEHIHYSRDNDDTEPIINVHENLENNKINESQTNNVENSDKQSTQAGNIENGDCLMSSNKQSEHSTSVQSTKVHENDQIPEEDKTSDDRDIDEEENGNENIAVTTNDTVNKCNNEEIENDYMQDREVQNTDKTDSGPHSNTNIDEMINEEKQDEICNRNKTNVEAVRNNEKNEVNESENVVAALQDKVDDGINLQATHLVTKNDQSLSDDEINNALVEAVDNSDSNERNTKQSTASEASKNTRGDDNDIYMQPTQKIDYFANADIQSNSKEDLQNIERVEDDIYMQPTQQIDHFVNNNVLSPKQHEQHEKQRQSIKNSDLLDVDDRFKKPSDKIKDENIFLAPTQKIESLKHDLHDVYLQPTQKICEESSNQHDVYLQPTQKICEENQMAQSANNDDIFLQPTQLLSEIDSYVNKQKENSIFLHPTQINAFDNQNSSDKSDRNIPKLCADVESQLEVMFCSQDKFSEADISNRPIDPVASILSVSETVETDNGSVSNDVPSCTTPEQTMKKSSRNKKPINSSTANAEIKSTQKRQKRKMSTNQNEETEDDFSETVNVEIDNGVISNDVPSFTVLDQTGKRNTRRKKYVNDSITNAETNSTQKRQKHELTTNKNKDTKNDFSEIVNVETDNDAISNDVPSLTVPEQIGKRNTGRKKSVNSLTADVETNSTQKRQKRKLSTNQNKDTEYDLETLQSVDEIVPRQDKNLGCVDETYENDKISVTISTRSKRLKSETNNTNTNDKRKIDDMKNTDLTSSTDASKNEVSIYSAKETLQRGKRTKLKSSDTEVNVNENETSYLAQTKTIKSVDAKESNSSSNSLEETSRRGKSTRLKSSNSNINVSETSTSETKSTTDGGESDSSSNLVKATTKKGKRTKLKSSDNQANDASEIDSSSNVVKKFSRGGKSTTNNNINENEASTNDYLAQTKSTIDGNETNSSSKLVKATPKRGKRTKLKSSDNQANDSGEMDSSSNFIKDSSRRGKRTTNNNKNESEASTSDYLAQTKSTTDGDEIDSSSNLVKATPKRGNRTLKLKSSDNEANDASEMDNFVKKPSKGSKRAMSKSSENDGNESEASSSSYSVNTKRTKTSLLNETDLLSTPQRNKRKMKPKVVFTMFESPEMEMLIKRLGGSVVDTVDACTVLITKCVKRSQKLLSAVGQGKPICSPSWLEACKKANQFLDPWDYIIKDEEAENKWKFSLEESLQTSSNEKLLSNYKFLLLVTTASDVLRGAIEACDGKCVTKAPPKSFKGNFVVVSDKNKTDNAKYKKQGILVVEAEAIFDGVLRQKLELEKHLL